MAWMSKDMPGQQAVGTSFDLRYVYSIVPSARLCAAIRANSDPISPLWTNISCEMKAFIT